MGANSLFKTAIEQQKNLFNANYNTILIAQGHMEQMAENFWKQTNIPEESIKTFESAIGECNKSRDTIKKFIDESYGKCESFFSS